MAKNWFNISNKEGRPEITIIGDIGPYDEVDYEGFRNQFKELEKTYNEAEIRIHCNGGSMFEGFAIANMIQASNMKTIGVVEGIAASMAGPIFLACTERKMMPNSRVMVHRPKAGDFAESEQLRELAKTLDELEGEVVEFYVNQTGQKEDTVKGWMKPGVMTWISAKDCKKYGITHEVIDGPANSFTVPANLFKKRPDEVFDFYNQAINTQPEMNKFKMLMVAMFGKFNIQHSLTEADDEQKYVDTATSALKAKDDKIVELQNQLKSKTEAISTSLVNNAVAAGLLKEEQRSAAMKLANEDLDAANALWGGAPAATTEPENKTPDIVSLLRNGGKKPEEGNQNDPRANWDYQKWQNEDPKGWMELEKKDPTKAKTIEDAFYGTGTKG